MNLQSPFLSLPSVPLVLDASALINLLGTGTAGEILAHLARPVLVEDVALAELTRHPLPDRDHKAEVATLLEAGLLTKDSMSQQALDIFHDLTSNDIAGGLDDGEAATIAFAVSDFGNAIPVIDEKKANRIFVERWATRTATDSVTVISQRTVIDGLQHDGYVDAIYSALFHARMRTPKTVRPWLENLLGSEHAAACPSLGIPTIRSFVA